MKKKLVWLTNYHQNEVSEFINARQDFHDLEIGDPEPTKDFTVEELKGKGIIGIYKFDGWEMSWP
jgi:hypothetical protein